MSGYKENQNESSHFIIFYNTMQGSVTSFCKKFGYSEKNEQRNEERIAKSIKTDFLRVYDIYSYEIFVVTIHYPCMEGVYMLPQ